MPSAAASSNPESHPAEIGVVPHGATITRTAPYDRVPTLLIVDDHAAVRASLVAPEPDLHALDPILGMLGHGPPPCEVADTLSVATDWPLRRRAILRDLGSRQSGRTLHAMDARMLMAHQHRSPIR
jgi:hypothetical protein